MAKKPVKKAPPKQANPILYYDRERRTCLKMGEAKGMVRYVALITHAPLRAQAVRAAAFALQRAAPDYPNEKAAGLFLRYSMDLGASAEVVDFLAKHTKVSPAARATVLSKVKALEEAIPKAPKPGSY